MANISELTHYLRIDRTYHQYERTQGRFCCNHRAMMHRHHRRTQRLKYTSVVAHVRADAHAWAQHISNPPPVAAGHPRTLKQPSSSAPSALCRSSPRTTSRCRPKLQVFSQHACSLRHIHGRQSQFEGQQSNDRLHPECHPSNGCHATKARPSQIVVRRSGA